MTKSKYVLNRRSGVLHRVPTKESCNVDQVPRKFKLFFPMLPTVRDRVHLLSRRRIDLIFCGHCFSAR
jgi:hypothetical protein